LPRPARNSLKSLIRSNGSYGSEATG
jgi:hypothetical protein